MMREGLILGVDFEPVTKAMWQILSSNFSLKPSEHNQGTTGQPLVRSFEKIGLGVRTQLEYFF
jgi:hypothetical protein